MVEFTLNKCQQLIQSSLINREYIRVPKQKQLALQLLVFKEGYQIKQAASQLSIKYAAAKSIIEKLRQKNRKMKVASLQKQECSYKTISKEMTITFSVVASQLGEITQFQSFRFNPK